MNKTITGFTVKSADKGLVSAVFSTFGVVDKDGDVTEVGAIADGTKVIISAYGHKSWEGLLPVGKGTIRTTETEAILDGQFFLDTTAGRDTFNVVKALAESEQGEWSYSLRNVVSKVGDFAGQRVNFLQSIEVNEVSPVLVGAGVDTRTLAAKGLTSLQDQITEAMGVVSEVIDSAERVVALRAEKGKPLSNVNAESLAGLHAEMDRLKALFDTKADESAEVTPEEDEAIKAIAADVRRRELFSNLIQNGA